MWCSASLVLGGSAVAPTPVLVVSKKEGGRWEGAVRRLKRSAEGELRVAGTSVPVDAGGGGEGRGGGEGLSAGLGKGAGQGESQRAPECGRKPSYVISAPERPR